MDLFSWIVNLISGFGVSKVNVLCACIIDQEIYCIVLKIIESNIFETLKDLNH